MALVVVVVIIIIVVVVVIWGDGSTELEFKTMIQNLVTTDSIVVVERLQLRQKESVCEHCLNE